MLAQSCFYHLRETETVTHAFTSSHLDCCNSQFSGLNQKNPQTADYKKFSCSAFNQGYDHITPVSASLHWLPVCFRIDFKSLLITFKALLDLAPDCIWDLWVPCEPGLGLRSSGRGLPALCGCRLKTKKGAKPLPESSQSSGTPSLWISLKTHLFNLAFNWFLFTFLC